MNLVGTLAKVAVGVIVARGVGKMMNKGRGAGSPAGGNPSGEIRGGSLGGGSIADDIGGGTRTGGGTTTQDNAPGDSALRDLLEGLNRGQSQTSGSAPKSGGGLGDLLGKVLSGGAGGGASQTRGGGGLEDLLKGIGRGRSQSSSQPQAQTRQGGGLNDLLEGIKRSAGTSSGNAPGGLGGILGKVLTGGGGLGGILESLGGSNKPGVQGSQQPGNGSLGDLLNQALGGKATREPPPEQNTQAEIMLRGMINAAKSDSQIDQDEQSRILDNLGDASREEIEFVRKVMAQPLNIRDFIRSVPKGLEQQVYLMSLLAIKLDSQAEAEYLDQLAQGLGISHDVANQLHAQVGAPNLYR